MPNSDFFMRFEIAEFELNNIVLMGRSTAPAWLACLVWHVICPTKANKSQRTLMTYDRRELLERTKKTNSSSNFFFRNFGISI